MSNDQDSVDWLNNLAENDDTTSPKRETVDKMFATMKGEQPPENVEPWNVGKPREESGGNTMLMIVLLMVALGLAGIVAMLLMGVLR